jgi:D-glycero-D-manno-heptose 1,7-bisphosphate phosphatase
MTSLIILDRDGVINFDSPDYIKSPEEWQPIPGSLEAIAKLNKAGFTVAVATNQSGVGRGFYTLATLELIHQKMHAALATLNGHIDMISSCMHHPDDHCECRKPKPGLMYEIARHFNIDLHQTQVLAIGDSLRDLTAAKTVGCQPILVLTGNGQKTLSALPADLAKILIYNDLAHAVNAIISQTP